MEALVHSLSKILLFRKTAGFHVSFFVYRLIVTMLRSMAGLCHFLYDHFLDAAPWC